MIFLLTKPRLEVKSVQNATNKLDFAPFMYFLLHIKFRSWPTCLSSIPLKTNLS